MCTLQCLHSSFSRLPAWLYSLRGMQQLSQLVWVMWASLMDMCQTLIFMASKLSFHLFSFTLGFLFHTLLPGSLGNLLNSGGKKKKKKWKLVSRPTATSKLMPFCCLSVQEVESCWGPRSPNSPAVWCSHFILERIEERWCSAARPKDTRRPSTGDAGRHDFSWFLPSHVTHFTQSWSPAWAVKVRER